MSAKTPRPLLEAIEAFGQIRSLTEEVAGVPRVQSALLRSRAGRIRELAELVVGKLDELAQLASEGLLDGDYRTIAKCADCLELAGYARSHIDGRSLCDECKRYDISGTAGR